MQIVIVLKGVHDVPALNDVTSLGIICYYCVCGRGQAIIMQTAGR